MTNGYNGNFKIDILYLERTLFILDPSEETLN